MLSGGKLKEVQVSLMLSSRSEMQKVIEAARSMTFPPLQPTLPAPAIQPGALPQQPLIPTQVPSVPSTQPAPIVQKPDQLKEIIEEEPRESRKRSRSRSRDRSRKESSRRRRSRSRDRDRRRKRSHSRSRGRDRYGRDAEKRVRVISIFTLTTFLYR